MTIQEVKSEDRIQLSVEGRVDVTSAPQLQTAILTALQKTRKLTVDMLGVEYVSSAGLRAILIGQKTAMSKGSSMVLCNVSEPVRQIFKVSGFEKLFVIE